LLTTSLPADPNHEGFQSQTILITGKKDATFKDQSGEERTVEVADYLLLDHEEMRKQWKDIRKDLDLFQFAQRRERWSKLEEVPTKVVATDTVGRRIPKDEFENGARLDADEQYRRLKGRLQSLESKALAWLIDAKKPGAAQVDPLADVRNQVEDIARLRARKEDATESELKSTIERLAAVLDKLKVESQEQPSMKPEEPRSALETFGAVKSKRLEKLRNLLNFGVTHAQVQDLEGRDRTLINLGMLKPRSIQQEGYISSSDNPDLGEIATLGIKANELPDMANGLMIVAPWGSVYCVDKEEVERVAVKVSSESWAERPTQERLSVFTEGNVPLGAILEPRDNQIGDGCACCVINLPAIKHEGVVATVDPNPAE